MVLSLLQGLQGLLLSSLTHSSDLIVPLNMLLAHVKSW